MGNSTAVAGLLLTSTRVPQCSATMCYAHGLDKTTKTMILVCNDYKLLKADEAEVTLSVVIRNDVQPCQLTTFGTEDEHELPS